MKKWIFLFLLILTACSPHSESKNNEMQPENTFMYQKYDIPLNDKLFLGNPEAEHTIFLAFDYACPWCKKWMLEVLPQLKETLIQDGTAKYIAQPVTLLNKYSLIMAEADYVIEKNIPEHYYNLQLVLAKFLNEDKHSNLGKEEQHIQSELEGLGYNFSELSKITKIPDYLEITRQFTKKFNVQYVPTVYVDGIKISDSFNIEEIKGIINKTIQEGEIISIPKR